MTSMSQDGRGDPAGTRPYIPLTGDPKTDEIARIINAHDNPVGICRQVLAELDAKQLLEDLCAAYNVQLIEATPSDIPNIGGKIHGWYCRLEGQNTRIVVIPAGLLPSQKAGRVARVLDAAGVPA